MKNILEFLTLLNNELSKLKKKGFQLDKYSKKMVNYKNSAEYNNIQRHYLMEILRYKNKINFIINKTFRSLEVEKTKNSLKIGLFFYITYRYFWENAKFHELNSELSQLLKNSEQKNLFKNFFNRLRTFSWEIALTDKNPKEILSIQNAIPTFLIQKLESVMDIDLIKKNV
ncbi:MAG: hypothetical protein GY870_09690, partial [archaeon]|nr:hypothetical protein [archaeon]